jgi:hypothetical protein
MARPLVSVASVRVSLTVITKHRTDRGACALWSRSLRPVMEAIVLAFSAAFEVLTGQF